MACALCAVCRCASNAGFLCSACAAGCAVRCRLCRVRACVARGSRHHQASDVRHPMCGAWWECAWMCAAGLCSMPPMQKTAHGNSPHQACRDAGAMAVCAGARGEPPIGVCGAAGHRGDHACEGAGAARRKRVCRACLFRGVFFDRRISSTVVLIGVVDSIHGTQHDVIL